MVWIENDGDCELEKDIETHQALTRMCGLPNPDIFFAFTLCAVEFKSYLVKKPIYFDKRDIKDQDWPGCKLQHTNQLSNEHWAKYMYVGEKTLRNKFVSFSKKVILTPLITSSRSE